MDKKKLTLWLAGWAIISAGLVGCRDTSSEVDKAVAESEQLRTELTDTQFKLVRLQKDNKQLHKNIDELFEDLESAESKLATALKSQQRAQTEAVKSMTRQVNEQAQRDMLEVTAQRDTSATQVEVLEAKVEQLRQQLTERDEIIKELDAWIAQVQADAAESDMVVETWESDPNAVLEEMTDEDNV